MTDAHHDAAADYQGRRGETKLFRAQQRGDDHVPAGFQLTVRLYDNAVPQLVLYQHLLRLGQAQFPG